MDELTISKSKLETGFLANVIVRLMKRDILERFTKTGEFTEEDQEFCDKIGWYPIDELEVKEEYVEKLKGIESGKHFKMTLDELDNLMEL